MYSTFHERISQHSYWPINGCEAKVDFHRSISNGPLASDDGAILIRISMVADGIYWRTELSLLSADIVQNLTLCALIGPSRYEVVFCGVCAYMSAKGNI